MKRMISRFISLALSALLLATLPLGTALAEDAAQAIDLDGIDGQLVIDSAGAYRLSGTLEGSVFVDPGAGDVTLILDGAAIGSADTAGITAVSGDSLTIVLAEDTENSVSDGGSDDTYDAAIYSAVALTFDGTGTLTVNGNNQEGISTDGADMTFNGGVYTVTSQDDGINAGGDGGIITFNGGAFTINASGDGIDSNASAVFNGATVYVVGSAAGGDAGIDTDGGYAIYGGSVIAIGTDMIEAPSADTTQTTLALTLDETVAEGSVVALVDTNGSTVAEFTALQSFRTLIVSSAALEEGSCRLLVNGEVVAVDGSDSVELTGTVTSIGGAGSDMPGPGGMSPGDMEFPEGMEHPEGMEPPEGMAFPDGQPGERPAMPDGQQGEPPAAEAPEAASDAD